MEEAPIFNDSEYVYLHTRANETVLLKKSVWEYKISKPERQFLAYNFQKIKQTVENPDITRVSKKNGDAQIFYKHFPDIWILPNVKTTFRQGYVAVVIQKNEKGIFVVKTLYTTDRIKE